MLRERRLLDIQYKGFKAKILFASDADVFYGTILSYQDIIAFQAKTLQTAEMAMQEAVRQYLVHITSAVDVT